MVAVLDTQHHVAQAGFQPAKPLAFATLLQTENAELGALGALALEGIGPVQEFAQMVHHAKHLKHSNAGIAQQV